MIDLSAYRSERLACGKRVESVWKAQVVTSPYLLHPLRTGRSPENHRP
jgi:hypothetical protein